MLESFINPWAMAAGTALVSAPIIIHLINRVKFRRIRWAAMEFLLKAQKRSRRKLIIEQLLLLLLRILLILLLGLLLGRFLGFKGLTGETEVGRNTLHVIILDDQPSMGDVWKEDGKPTTSFDLGRRLIVDEILKRAAEATSQQEVVILRLSELDQPYPLNGTVRLNSTTLEEIRNDLAKHKPSSMRVDIQEGIAKADTYFNDTPNFSYMLHIVSDFRTADWGQSKKEEMSKLFKDLAQAKREVHLLDVGYEQRTEDKKTPNYNENLAIVELKPDVRIAAKDQPVFFNVKVANYSNSEKKNVRVAMRVNGRLRDKGSVTFSSIPANQTVALKSVMALDRVASENDPLDRFNLVSAHLEPEPEGLNGDNTRFTVIEVRPKVPILMIEGNSANRGRQESEAYYLYRFLNDALRGFEVRIESVAALERPDLHEFSSIYILDVPQFSDKALKNLEDYVANGGGVGFFMGPGITETNIKDFYNTKLYKEGNGLFPVPIDLAQDKSPHNASLILKDSERTARRFSFQKQILVRDDQLAHGALQQLYFDERGAPTPRDDFERYLMFVIIDRYFRVDRLQWKNPGGKTAELMTLRNYTPSAAYAGIVERVLGRFPIEDPKAEPWKEALRLYKARITNVLNSTKPLYELSAEIKRCLEDKGEKEKNIPGLEQLWAMSEYSDLATEFKRVYDIVTYGDPLYLGKSYGKGQVTAFLSSAGKSWNDLDSGNQAAYYPLLVKEMQRYLGGSGLTSGIRTGTKLEYDFDPKLFGGEVKRTLFMSLDDAGASGQPDREVKVSRVELGKLALDKVTLGEEEFNRLTFTKGKKSGAYIFELTQTRTDDKGGNPIEIPDYRAISMNLDTDAESNLRRVDSDELKSTTNAQLHTPDGEGYEKLTQKQHDLSESFWLFLLILLIFLAEQAMAVRLSYHNRAADATNPAVQAAPDASGMIRGAA